MLIPDWPPDWPEIRAAMLGCFEDRQWGRYHSEVVRQLGLRLTTHFGADSVRLCCSGTAAVELCLRAIGVGDGDEVIVAALDYPGNVRCVELLGAKPVLLDVAEGSGCLDAMQVEGLADRETGNIKAVIASHLYGAAADVERLRQDCDRRGWVLIEDACQVAGMRIGERAAGGFGHLGTLSFGGSKLISAGAGGAVISNDPRWTARLSSIVDRPSDAFPMPGLSAAVIGPQWDRLEEMNRARAATAEFFREQVLPRLADWRWESGSDARVTPAFYKVAFSVGSAEQRRRIVGAAEAVGLPIGEGFRSMHRTSDRRCRKPLPLDRAARLGDTLLVLDHRALLIAPQRWGELAECLWSL